MIQIRRQGRDFRGFDTFHLPADLLKTVQRFCDERDWSRSQFYRHAVRQTLRQLGELKDDEADEAIKPKTNMASGYISPGDFLGGNGGDR